MITRLFLIGAYFSFLAFAAMDSAHAAPEKNMKEFGAPFGNSSVPYAFSDPAEPDPSMLNDVEPAAGEEQDTDETVPFIFRQEEKVLNSPEDEDFLHTPEE